VTGSFCYRVRNSLCSVVPKDVIVPKLKVARLPVVGEALRIPAVLRTVDEGLILRDDAVHGAPAL
jgi:hypothetical protein